jgi:uncharacterized protein (TIGR03437 family)
VATNIAINPLTTGDIWITLRTETTVSTPHPLYHSSDGGKTFTALTTLDRANYAAFGKGASATVPALYVQGRASGDTDDGIYQSLDLGATWTRVSEPRMNQFGPIMALAGDMRTRDLVYVALGGRGLQYGFGPLSGLPGGTLQPSSAASAASPALTTVAPGELISVGGVQLLDAAPQSNRASGLGLIPTVLDGLQILFDGQPAPIFATADGQAVVQVPYGIAGQSAVAIQQLLPFGTIAGDFSAGQRQSTSSTMTSLPLALNVAASAPGVFAGASGAGQVIAINADGRLNSPADPAAKGSIVTLYLTGAGVENRSIVDGQIAEAPLWAPAGAVAVQFGGVSASPVSASAAAGAIAGLTQVTAAIPASAASGAAVPVIVSVGGTPAQTGLTVAIR